MKNTLLALVFGFALTSQGLSQSLEVRAQVAIVSDSYFQRAEAAFSGAAKLKASDVLDMNSISGYCVDADREQLLNSKVFVSLRVDPVIGSIVTLKYDVEKEYDSKFARLVDRNGELSGSGSWNGVYTLRNGSSEGKRFLIFRWVAANNLPSVYCWYPY